MVDHEPRVTGSAKHGALEILVVALGTVPREVVGRKDALHCQPNFGFDQAWVFPVIANTLIDDIAFVIRVA